MYKFKYILLLFLVLMACEKDIEIALNKQEDQLVMYAFIYPDSALNIHFSKSQSILSVPNYEQVEQGRFRMYINDEIQGTYILPADTVWSKWKEFSFAVGDKVKIEAYELDGDTVKVESYIPDVIPFYDLDTVTITQNLSDLGPTEMLRTKLSFEDPGGVVNYYQLHIVREGFGIVGGEPYYTRKAITYEKDDPVFTQGEQSGSLLQGIDFQGLFSDGVINGLNYRLGFNIPRDNLFFDYYEDKIKITIYLYHHTYDYYSYFRSKILSAGYDGFYDGLPVFEPVRIHNNIDNGLGLVSGMSFDADSLVFYK